MSEKISRFTQLKICDCQRNAAAGGRGGAGRCFFMMARVHVIYAIVVIVRIELMFHWRTNTTQKSHPPTAMRSHSFWQAGRWRDHGYQCLPSHLRKAFHGTYVGLRCFLHVALRVPSLLFHSRAPARLHLGPDLGTPTSVSSSLYSLQPEAESDPSPPSTGISDSTGE